MCMVYLFCFYFELRKYHKITKKKSFIHDSVSTETRSTTLAVSATASSTEEQFNTTDSGNDETTTEFMWGKEDSATTHSSCGKIIIMFS